MTDQEKIEWFNQTIEWVDSNGGSEAIIDMADNSSDIAYDLFFDFIKQYEKEKNEK